MSDMNSLKSEIDALTAIKTRRSIRSFKDQDVPKQIVEELLRCAMHAPSAGGAAPWDFVVIKDKEILKQIGQINPYATFAVKSPLSILVCGNLQREKFPNYWIEDTSAAMENLLVAVNALGLGACWTGIYPMQDRVEAISKLIKLPETVIPMGLAVIGYPEKIPETKDRFDLDRVHYDIWGNKD